MATVQIVGIAPSAMLVPPTTDGARWCFGYHHMYRVRCPQALATWTRWFNMHSFAHMERTYPAGVAWYARQTKPVTLQDTFPREQLLAVFPRYFTCSLAWLLALAVFEGFTRIELWGVGGDRGYEVQWPCLAYWIAVARARGIEVVCAFDFGPPGDPAGYTGPLYGFETS